MSSYTLAKATAIDAYTNGHLIPPDPALEAALKNNASANLAAIDVAPNRGKQLYLLAKMLKAKRILEIGTLGGYSTLWFAKPLVQQEKSSLSRLSLSMQRLLGRTSQTRGSRMLLRLKLILLLRL